MRRSRWTRPNVSTRSRRCTGLAPSPMGTRLRPFEQEHVYGPTRGDGVAVREDGQRVGVGHGEELVRTLAAGRSQVVAAVVVDLGDHPVEMDFAVGVAAHGLVGDRWYWAAQPERF